jgi:hypothetical protein
MGSHYENREHDTREQPVRDPSPFSGLPAMFFRARRPGLGGLPEPGMLGVTWPLNNDEFMRREIHRNLEQIGQILRRLDVRQAEIDRLGTETRAILAELTT